MPNIIFRATITMLENKIPFIVVAFMSVGLFISIMLYSDIGFESLSDLIFEGSTLILLTYIFLTAYHKFKSDNFLFIGAYLLIFNKGYDLLTEVPVIENYSDQFEVIDTILDDGSLFIGFLLIAIGITRIMQTLVKQSMKDELTNLYNRKKFPDIKLTHFDLIYFDLNNLKIVNDTKGHQVGDLMIIRFAQVLKIACTEQEMAFRIGGDEFIVTAESDRSSTYIDEIYAALSNERISFSYGIEKATKENFEEALIRSDKAMYTMKRSKKKST